MAVQVTPRKAPNNSVIINSSQDKIDKLNKVRTGLDDVFAERDVMYRANQYGYQYVNLYGKPIDTADLVVVSEIDARKYKMGVFKTEGKDLFLATPEPSMDQVELLKSLKDRKYDKLELYLCSERSFDKLLKTYSHAVIFKDVEDDISITDEVLSKFKNSHGDLATLEDELKHVPTSDFVNIVLASALINKASDIHFEPNKDDYELRLRLDGVLYTFGSFNKDIQHRVESRIKILSELKLNVDNVPQDGRFSFSYEGKDIDVRVSMLPSNYGYSIVMRLLGTGNVNLDLESLGFYNENRLKIEKSLEKHQGMILTTGPTGSGKTTTLYTFLNMLNDGSNKIITLEDPIEYKLKGVSQTQIDEAAGYTFAGGLRSILRQDPDVVMVGEIRDKETADVAIQAALTGHKVLSTLHTNDAVGAISRFMEIGIDGYMIADSVQVIVGQRLIRRLCEHCKEEYSLTPEESEIVIAELGSLPEYKKSKLPEKPQFYHSKGCVKCNNLGYKGRVGVYEVLTMSDGLRNLLTSERPSFVQIRSTAKSEGMITLRQDAILKALAGFTDVAEVLKNVD